MAQYQLSDAEVSALQATQAGGESAVGVGLGGFQWSLPNETYPYKMTRQEMRLRDMIYASSGCMAFKSTTGALNLGITAGEWYVGNTAVNFAETEAVVLTNAATNYVYITAAGVATVSVVSFPDPLTIPFLPVAIVICAGGIYAYSDIDHTPRWRAFMSPVGIAGVETRCGVTAAAEVANVRAVTVQARDAAGTAIAGRFLIHVWISLTDYGIQDAAGNTVAMTTGTIEETRTANSDYTVISDVNGKIVFDLTIAGAADRYIMAEIDGHIYSSGILSWAA